jgi:hypothetical protein
VRITDIGGEEFDVAPARGVTEVRDQCRHNQRHNQGRAHVVGRHELGVLDDSR